MEVLNEIQSALWYIGQIIGYLLTYAPYILITAVILAAIDSALGLIGRGMDY